MLLSEGITIEILFRLAVAVLCVHGDASIHLLCTAVLSIQHREQRLRPRRMRHICGAQAMRNGAIQARQQVVASGSALHEDALLPAVESISILLNS